MSLFRIPAKDEASSSERLASARRRRKRLVTTPDTFSGVRGFDAESGRNAELRDWASLAPRHKLRVHACPTG